MYLFDTNLVSELARRHPLLAIEERFHQVPPEQRFISSVTLQELRFGAASHPDPTAIWARIESNILPFLRVLDFGPEEALVAGNLEAEIRRAGRPMSLEDLMIAATALARDLTLVTRNTRHFQPVPGLKIENWFE